MRCYFGVRYISPERYEISSDAPFYFLIFGVQAIKMMRDVNPPGRGGRILNVSSIGGYIGNQSLSFYSAGKFGTIHIFDYFMCGVAN